MPHNSTIIIAIYIILASCASKSRFTGNSAATEKIISIKLIVNGSEEDINALQGDTLSLSIRPSESTDSLDSYDCRFYKGNNKQAITKSGPYSATITAFETWKYSARCTKKDKIANDELTVTVEKPDPIERPDPPDTTVVCNEGESLLEDGTCVRSVYNECEKFIQLEIANNGPARIPSLESDGVCYYKKIIESTDQRDDSNVALDVISDNHSGGANERNPWVLGAFSGDFIFEGKRTISLAGNFVAEVDKIDSFPIIIDNYLLIEIKPENEQTIRMARGSGDSTPIRVNPNWPQSDQGWVDVTDFIAYSNGGKTTVPKIDLSASFEINENTNIRIRMLDCGGASFTSDVYLIIH